MRSVAEKYANLLAVKRYKKRHPEVINKWRKTSLKFRRWTKYHSDKRHQFINHLKNKPCMDCHDWFQPCQMDFDHRDPLTKDRDISKLWSCGRKRMLEEIKKCDLVCANCHRWRTYRRVHAL